MLACRATGPTPALAIVTAKPTRRRRRLGRAKRRRARAAHQRGNAKIPEPAYSTLFSLDIVAKWLAGLFWGWLKSRCKNNHIGPRSRRLFYLAILTIVPQRTPGTQPATIQNRGRRQGSLATVPIFLKEIQQLAASTAPGVSPPVPAISLKNDVQTMAYPAGGAVPFILLSLPNPPSPPDSQRKKE